MRKTIHPSIKATIRAGMQSLRGQHDLSAEELLAAIQEDTPSLDGHKRELALMMVSNIQSDLDTLKTLLMMEDGDE